jgi:hypothetical protein
MESIIPVSAIEMTRTRSRQATCFVDDLLESVVPYKNTPPTLPKVPIGISVTNVFVSTSIHCEESCTPVENLTSPHFSPQNLAPQSHRQLNPWPVP